MGMAIYLIIHCIMRPFKWKRLNIVEGVCLFSLLLVIGSSTHSSRNNQDFTDTFIAFVIILPFLFVFIYSFIAIRNVRRKKTKQIEKVKLRAPVPIRNDAMEIQWNHIDRNRSDSSNDVESEMNEKSEIEFDVLTNDKNLVV